MDKTERKFKKMLLSKLMRLLLFLVLLLISNTTFSQSGLRQPFDECGVTGSTTIFDQANKSWLITDSLDASKGMQPASTFKIINLLIALETRAIRDENEIIKWPGSTDTTLYGYRPEIYKDISVKEAFEVSAGWAFIEIAKRIDRRKYRHFLSLSGYGNVDLSEKGDDFWNFGPMVISPKNQVEFLIKIHERKLPFSKRNFDILKNVMVTEQTKSYAIYSKTGWTRIDGKDIGWWVGYVERNDNTIFFATRITKPRSLENTAFGNCRKQITRHFLRQLGALEM